MTLTRLWTSVRTAISGRALAASKAAVTEREELAWPLKITRVAALERARPQLTAAAQTISRRPLISVVMTTYNSESFVEPAIHSILGQTYKNLEIVVVDDASTDRTLVRLNALRRKTRRLRIVQMTQNRGTYFAKNSAIRECRGELITFMDSDDISAPLRLEKQLGMLRSPGAVASTCSYVRKNPAGDILMNRGVLTRPGLITLLIKRAVFDEVGFFDSVRASADAEFFDRIKTVYGRKAVPNVEEALYFAVLREGCLTMEPGNSNDLDQTSLSKFLSPARLHYTRSYQSWHRAVIGSGKVPYMPFPLEGERAFGVYGKMRI